VVVPVGLTQSRALEWLRCAESKAYFINTYIKIKDPVRGIVPFWLHPFQVNVLDELEENRRNLILKARQMGLSWLVAADDLHDAIFREAYSQLIISKREKDAYALMKRIQFMFDRLPDWLKPEVVERNKSILAFDNESEIESQPTTEDAGRSRAISKLTVDELAFCRHDTALINSADTALAQGGKAVLLSTANGYGNEFARLWFASVRGENNYKPIFLPWYAYPGRDEEWLEAETKGKQAWQIAQEFPSTWEEAFRQTGRPVFDEDCLALTAANTAPLTLDGEADAYRELSLEGISKAPILPEEEPHKTAVLRRQLFIYQKPQPEHLYLIGADPAEGLIHGDNSAVMVLDRETGEEVASFYGRCGPDDFACLLHEIAQLYPGLLVVERNNHGQAVLVLLEGWNTPHLFWQKPVWNKTTGQKIKDRKSGWETRDANKTLMIDELAMGLKLRDIKIASKHFAEEGQKFETQEDGRYSAAPGHRDDAIMACALAWQGRKHLILMEGMLTSGEKRTSLSTKWDE
jgi:hypothetical protein